MWIERCIESIAGWARHAGFHHRLIGDELFDYLGADFRGLVAVDPVVASDLARLEALRHALGDYDTVVWCDADFIVFDPTRFVLPDEPFCVGREIWVEEHPQRQGRLRAFKQVHNALLMFRRGNPFLGYYIYCCRRILARYPEPAVAQTLGPKLLSALHNVAALPVMETAAVLPPRVRTDVLNGGGPALSLLRARSAETPAGVNLCRSYEFRDGVHTGSIQCTIDLLLRSADPFCWKDDD